MKHLDIMLLYKTIYDAYDFLNATKALLIYYRYNNIIKMTSSTSETEEQEIYRVISDALLCLCEQKPNDPVDFLSRKMLELIGDDPSTAVRKKEIEEEGDNVKVNENIIFSAEKLAIMDISEKFDDHYKIIEELSLHTFKVEDLSNENVPKAARIVNKKTTNIFLSDKKIKMLSGLDHPNIIKIFKILEDDDYIYIIHDFCEGKDLFSFLLEHKEKITEDIIRKIINQLLTGVSYLHQNNILHKNIIPSKVLVYSSDLSSGDIQIKISDFVSNSEYFTKGELTYKSFGNKISNPLFMAPEFIEEKYDNKVDIWSIGVLSYILLIGYPPFKGKEHEILYNISHKKIHFPEYLNETKKNFLEEMLGLDPNDRLDASQLLKDQYFSASLEDLTKVSMTTTNISPESNIEPVSHYELAEVMNNMASFTIGQNFRRSVLSFVVGKKLYEENDAKLRKIFDALDVDHNGTIETKELFAEYRKLFPGTTREKWKKIKLFIENADINKDGKISYGEFLTIMNMTTKELSKDTLQSIFNQFDVNKTGFIDAYDMKEMFEDTNITDKQIHDMLDEIDKNGDRKISFEEFYELMTKKYD